MNNGIYEKDDIIVRKVRVDDNFEDIAELIYETDDYIYPYFFHDSVIEAKSVLAPLMKEDGFFFNYKSMYIAIDKNDDKIVGLICLIEPGTDLDYDYSKLRNADDRYRFTVDNYIVKLIQEVKEFGLPYISNVCVHHDYRGKKIGNLMFGKVIDEKREYYKKFLLDVLADNPGAINVYKKFGFEITGFYMDIGYGPGNYTPTYSMEYDTFKHR